MPGPSTHTRELWLGRGLCLAAAVLWSTAGWFIKDLTRSDAAGWSGWQVAGFRSLIAGVTLLILSRIWPRRSAPAVASLLPTGKQVLLACAYAGTLLTYVLAQTFTTTANAIFLQYTAPIYVLLLSPWLLKERPRSGDLLTLPALAVGIYLILSAELRFDHGAFGNVMALVSGVGYALVIMLMRKWHSSGALGGVALGNFLLAAVGLTAATFTPQGFLWPDLRSGVQILWLGAFQIGLAYFLFQACLRHITAVEAALLTLIEPVLCPLWAWAFAGDVPPTLSLIGGGSILAALGAHTWWKARKDAPCPPPAAFS